MLELCRNEIIQLHEFFEDWLNGRILKDNITLSRVKKVLSDDFEIITPNGNRNTKPELLKNLKKAHGSWSGEKIRIKNINGREFNDTTCLVTYEEWQGRDENPKGRLSSAWFCPTHNDEFPVQWMHLHEVWI